MLDMEQGSLFETENLINRVVADFHVRQRAVGKTEAIPMASDIKTLHFCCSSAKAIGTTFDFHLFCHCSFIRHIAGDSPVGL